MTTRDDVEAARVLAKFRASDAQALIDVALPLAEAGTQMGASRERAILGRAFILLHAENAELRSRVRELGELAEDQFRMLEGRQPKLKRKVIGEKEKKP